MTDERFLDRIQQLINQRCDDGDLGGMNVPFPYYNNANGSLDREKTLAANELTEADLARALKGGE